MIVGGAMVVAWLLIALLAPVVAPYDPIKVTVGDALRSPSLAHLLGTDDLGRDVLSRVIWGSRISLSVGLISVGIGFFVGVSVGLAAGYLGGKFDLFVMRGVDALLAFPALVLAIAITAALGPQIQNAMIAIGIVAIPAYARLTRGQTLAIRSRDFILAARTVGCTPLRIVTRHVFPNITNALIVQATLSTAFAILAEAALSFLGLGPQPPDPSWGQDVAYSTRYLANMKWWMSVGPGLAIFSAVFAFNFLGDALRDALDPRLRRSG
ncbi:MAG: ABC transporter permease [Chloroflexi bacterium]|nr:MAG: ABC transporter permease [Chloroflexota bacterium]TMF63713.1 MAG: ABC transporter permease [Chloroflexota bacterium]TMG57810.1 MAG: ABC transporter permease [Chloroflexota bacterium]